MYKRLYFSMSSQLAEKSITKSFIVLNVIVIVMITSYLIIIGNIDLSSSSQSISLTIQQFSMNETIAKIEALDQYLSSFKLIEKEKDSRLVYPNEISDMTTMTIDKTYCTPKLGADLLLLIMVLNRVDDFDRRQTIRKSWGKDFKNHKKSKLYFAVGLPKDVTIQKRVEDEDRVYNDIIQWGYYESYYNCTIKVLGILRWTALNCPLVKFVLKSDDDSLLVSDNLLNFCYHTFPNTIYGHLWRNPQVFRNITSKWAITTKDYSDIYYPNFIGGPYLIPGSTALALYQTAIRQSLPAIPFEDVYITGIVAAKLNIPRKEMKGHVYLDPLSNCDIEKLDICWYYRHSIFWQGINDTSMIALYRQIKALKPTLCPKLSLHTIYSNFYYYFKLLFIGYKACVLV